MLFFGFFFFIIKVFRFKRKTLLLFFGFFFFIKVFRLLRKTFLLFYCFFFIIKVFRLLRKTLLLLYAFSFFIIKVFRLCLLYTSDAADDMQCVDLGGRRIIKKLTSG